MDSTRQLEDATELLLEQERVPLSVPLLIDDEEESCSQGHQGATILQGVFNVVNIFMGIGLLSMAFAMKSSGWAGLAVLAAAGTLFCFSGKLIVRAFDKIPAGIAHTYPELGMRVLGWPGRYVVVFLSVAEFFGGSCMVLVVIWRELVTMLPNADILGVNPFRVAVPASLLTIGPMLLLPSFKKLSYLNACGFLSTLVITLVVIVTLVVDPSREKMPTQPPPGHHALSWGVISAAGIFAVSVSGHSSLPALRNSMARASDFDAVLNFSFLAMLSIYGSVAGIGYYYFGDAASDLITTDLAINSPFTGHYLGFPEVTVDAAVSVFILINLFTTYPSLVLVIQDMIISALPVDDFRTGRLQPTYRLAAGIRLAIFATGAAVSFMAYNVLGNVMSLVGGVCSMCCSLLMPSFFYLVLYWKELSVLRRGGVIFILVAGLSLVGLVIAQNADQLIHLHAGGGEGGGDASDSLKYVSSLRATHLGR